MSGNKILRLLSLSTVVLSLSACGEYLVPQADDSRGEITAQIRGTKTTISDNVISWSAGESLGITIVDQKNGSVIQKNICVSNSGTSSLDEFKGFFNKVGIKGGSAKNAVFYAYYPCQLASYSSSVVETKLPNFQKAPFDSAANYMVSDGEDGVYDEDDMPAITYRMKQLLGIIELDITSTDNSLKDMSLMRVTLSSSEIMSGAFHFDIVDPFNTLDFSGAGNFCSVRSEYPGGAEPKVGMGVTNRIYMFVNPRTYSGFDLTVTLKSESGLETFKMSMEGDVAVSHGNITKLSAIDLATFSHSQTDVRKISCFGDSYTHGGSGYTYTKYLREILGHTWSVYDGGVSGDTSIGIAARQGGIQFVTKDAFVLPPAQFETDFGGLCTVKDPSFMDNYYFRTNWSIPNPCMINGVLCNVTNTSVTRLSPGAEMNVEEHTPVYTYPSYALKDADVCVIYMGQNGGWDDDLESLINQHKAMIDFLDKGQYIVCGFHNSRSNAAYVNRYKEVFGDHFLDLHNEVIDRYKELLIRTGFCHTESEISPADVLRVENDKWPVNFCLNEGNIHPNGFGSHAMAILIYEKMEELGYLDD